MQKTKKEINLLEGALLPKILNFVFPLLLMDLLQRLYNAADMVVVGYSPVKGAIGAIGTTGAMLNLFINAFGGFSIGANVLVARYIGARDAKRTKITLHTSVAVSFIFGIIGTVVAFIVVKPLLILLGDQGEILRLALLYSRIYCLSYPFLSLTNVFMAIFRAKGDTRTPLMVMSASGLVNVGLNFFFVLVLNRSVDGVAIATVLANVTSAFWLMGILMKDEGWCRFDLKELKIVGFAFRDLLSIGLPASVQGCLFSLSNMMIASSIITMNNLMNPGGSALLDGSSAVGNLEGFLYAATASSSQATVTFTSQHLGAGKFERMKKVRINCFAVGVCLSAVMCLLFYLLRDLTLGLYIHEDEAFRWAYVRLGIMYLSYPLDALMENSTAFLRGLGKSTLSAFITLVGVCAFRVFWNLVVFRMIFMTMECIFLSYPISWILTGAAAVWLGEREFRRLMAKRSVAR